MIRRKYIEDYGVAAGNPFKYRSNMRPYFLAPKTSGGVN